MSLPSPSILENFLDWHFLQNFFSRDCIAILIGKNVVLNQPLQILSPLFLLHLFNGFDGDYHFRSPMFTTFFVGTSLCFKASSFSSWPLTARFVSSACTSFIFSIHGM